MQIDPEYLRQHYGSLSDEGLLAIDRADLVETARMILDLEIARRRMARRRPDPPDETEDYEAEVDGETYGGGEEPDWLEDAAEVSSYCVPSRSAPAPDSAVDARDALEAAGIPWYFDICEIPPEKSLLPYGTHRWRVMVPGKLYLRATGVVEREISGMFRGHRPRFCPATRGPMAGPELDDLLQDYRVCLDPVRRLSSPPSAPASGT